MSHLSKQQRRQLRLEYSGLYETFVWLFADYDPMRLIRLGAPSNEYDLEVEVTLSRLSEASNASDLTRIAYQSFVECFGNTFDTPNKRPTEITKRNFDVLGKEMWDSWKRWEENKNINGK
jgi:hypothetical protein